MSHKCVLGRDFIFNSNVSVIFHSNRVVIKNLNDEMNVSEIMFIQCSDDVNEKQFNINPELDCHDKIRVKNINNDYYVTPERPEQLDINYSMKVRLKPEHDPIAFRPRRLSYAEKKEVDETLKDLLDREIIRESTSPFASPVFLIGKKCGKLRMCIDFRELNKLCIKDRQPMPVIEDQIAKLADFEIKINSSIKYQTIFGFGGAFTDSFGINLRNLNEKAQKKLLEAYFSDDGIEYSLCRVPIGGTDFSTRPYTYDDEPGDEKLEKFNLTLEDYRYKIPFIREAVALRKGRIDLFASPWSAPAWVKTNNALSGIGILYQKYYQYWADYYVKFLEHYEKENIDFWAVTTGNEPLNGLVPFVKINSMGWTPRFQSQWISENLGPTIRKSKFKDIKIISGDDQRFFLPWFPKKLFRNKTTKNYVDGIAVHWYWDDIVPVSLVQATHDDFPEKFILASEACVGDRFYQKAVVLGSWHRGEKYMNDIIEDINHWVTGWIDWNMALNDQGGPTYIDNFVDSPIIVNASAQEFYKNPMFYALGHFSKFVPAKSKRIHFEINNNNIKISAFERPDGGISIVVFNGNYFDAKIRITDDKRGYFETVATKNSFNTYIYW